MLSANNLLDKLSALDERTVRLLDAAERTGQLRTALAAIHESRGNIEAFARITLDQDISRRVDELEQLLNSKGS